MLDSDFEMGVKKYEEKSLPLYLEMVELTNVKPGDLVLDVGCGGCPLLNTNREYEIVGLDIDKDCLDVARGRGGTFLAQGNARYLPFKTESFDAVIAASLPPDAFPGMLEYLDSVREMARVLKPGGRIAILEDTNVITGRIAQVVFLLYALGFYDKPKRTGIACATRPEKLNDVPRAYSWDLAEEMYPK